MSDTSGETGRSCSRCHGSRVTTVTTYHGTHSTSAQVDCACVERGFCRHCDGAIVLRNQGWVHRSSGSPWCPPVTRADPQGVHSGGDDR